MLWSWLTQDLRTEHHIPHSFLCAALFLHTCRNFSPCKRLQTMPYEVSVFLDFHTFAIFIALHSFLHLWLSIWHCFLSPKKSLYRKLQQISWLPPLSVWNFIRVLFTLILERSFHQDRITCCQLCSLIPSKQSFQYILLPLFLLKCQLSEYLVSPASGSTKEKKTQLSVLFGD